MNFTVSIKTVYNCSLERAFKTPILYDVSKIHTGYGIMPKVTHCTDDEYWGKPGYSKKIFVAPSLTQKGGWAFNDNVIARIENKYLKIVLNDFKFWILGFSTFTGEWETTELDTNKILIVYTYTLQSNSVLLYPAQWLFAHTFWRVYMKRVLKIVRLLAYNNEPYLYQ